MLFPHFVNTNPFKLEVKKCIFVGNDKQNSHIMKHYITIICSLLTAINLYAQDFNTTVGNNDLSASVMAKDFTLKDINGNDLSLSNLRGKYVVLDFWGSWCGWCMKGLPDMKAAYEKHKDHLEILGIDCNEPELIWKKTVEENAIPWLHVYNPDDSQVLADYGIEGFPTKVVIDPEGRILKTVVGETPEFYTYLDNLLGK